MSEPISAFAAYRSSTAKGGNNSKKGNNNKKTAGAGNKAAANKKNAAKNISFQKNKPEKATKSHVEPQLSNATEAAVATAKAKEVVKNKTAAKAESVKNKPSTHKAAVRSTEPSTKQKQKTQSAATNGKEATNGIKESEIDILVEQLLAESPSKPKKLTKSQQKKKQELEDYLVKQLERDDEAAGEEEYDSETGDEEDCSSGSDEFSDEYTINSYSDEEEEEEEEECEEEETSCSADDTSVADDDKQPIATSTTNSVSTKRKGNEKGSNLSEATEPKKARQAENPADKRKSMPTATTTNADKAAKATEKRRHTVADKGSEAAGSKQITVKTVDAAAVKMEPPSPPNNVVKMNSIEEGEKLFSWLLSPLNLKEFFKKYWETGACLVKRKGSNYYSKLISFEAIDQMLINNHVEFTKNIDITSYKNGVRETLNPVGRAMPPVVWDHYGQGCSVRLLNPHTFLPELFKLNTTLQEYFHCLVGANAYLTPPNSQGFAPHYDDIEAFVLQIEGRKRWRLYKPRTPSEQLPRFSSKNFTQQEIGQPIFDEVLEPGDLLYFPRGTIHQATTAPGYHSLHITLSVYQKQAYADLFELMMPLVLQRAIESNVDMRRGLPLHTFQHAGIAYSDNDTKERAELLRKVTKLMGQCLHSAQLAEVMDAAVDQLAKKYQHEALPPHVLPAERVRTIFGSRSTTNAKGECLCDYEIDERTNVRLLRANVMRLVQEEQQVRIYYYLDNSKEYREYELNFIEIEPEEAASVEVLIRSYPAYVGVSQLPLDDDERKVQLVTALWERGLLMTEKPFK